MRGGMQSMVALLGLLAVAGYRNRDKLAEAFAGRKPESTAGPLDRQSNILDKLGGLLSGGSVGTVLSDGLRELIECFKQNGQGYAADSWIGIGPNQLLHQEQFEQAIGPEVLSTLSQHTRLSKEELLARLTRDLPAAVDKFTPAGHLPTEGEAARLI